MLSQQITSLLVKVKEGINDFKIEAKIYSRRIDPTLKLILS